MDLFIGEINESVIEKAHIAYPTLPDYTLKALYRYVKEHIRTGDFLYAVLTNNLFDATGRADQNNREALFEIVSFCYNEIPAPCYGSEEKVIKWLRPKALH